MPKLTCFLHPEYSEENRALTDLCKVCGKPYGFPLTDAPKRIGEYEVLNALDRGFYSSAYTATVGPFKQKRVLKLVTRPLYDGFKKDFAAECREHARAADHSQHIAKIHDMKFDVAVDFNGTTIPCHIAELDYVDGDTLTKYLTDVAQLRATEIAQIAIDLFSLLNEFNRKSVWHNDLHAGNLMVERLNYGSRRADAIDPFVRLVAIDLNSVSDASKSDPDKQRLGDLQWVARHLKALVDRLLSQPDKTEDLDYRLASVLEERAQLISPASTSQRTPTFDECIEDIRDAIRPISSPWMERPALRRFNDAYNAQTLAPWFVPYLLVDPDDRWLAAISTPGPMVITGMRGCGKTMLLRAIQFHARATLPDVNLSPDAILGRLRSDRFLGLYTSCTRLLDVLGKVGQTFHEPFARLFVAYAIEALRTVRHLRDIDTRLVDPTAYKHIGSAVADHLRGGEELATAPSDYQLERSLLTILVRLSRGDLSYSLPSNPAEAFPHLAEAIRRCAPLWNNITILFLLDDVSTRYLKEPGIRELMSALLFANPECAFKLTTEAQTLELILRSPGQVEKARAGRDYEVFDLGAEVNELTRTPRGREFVAKVLSQRAKFYQPHPRAAPGYILGDTSLESIALRIASSAATSNERKKVYWGLSALTRVCVGDIGDIISLYELILRKSDGTKYPIDPQVQSECYQEFCSRRLYDLNRRSSNLKNHALSFAAASHELLLKSWKDNGQTSSGSQRLRQYLKIYVRLTAGDTDAQYVRLRDLIDAGVFVLDGGTQRTKTRDSDPIQQFKLTFRKLYGLSHFIGLAERDRFELSGDELNEWLENPGRGKEILLRNLASDAEESDDVELAPTTKRGDVGVPNSEQLELFKPEVTSNAPVRTLTEAEREAAALAASRLFDCSKRDGSELSKQRFDTFVLGLGFEDRTLESCLRILQLATFRDAVVVAYDEPGKSEHILRALKERIRDIRVIPYSDILLGKLELSEGNSLIDVTGLAKPAIFSSIRQSLGKKCVTWVCHTAAESHYPREADVDAVLRAEQNRDYYKLLDALQGVLTGERGPYVIDPLIGPAADESRRRVLCAFASPKQERLLSLLDQRAYESVQIICQESSTPRGKLARLSADFASRNYPGTVVTEFGTGDISGILDFLAKQYQEWYVDRGFNFELGLTGSKLQAVACAILSATCKISQCWYVRPQAFDAARFSSGTEGTTFLRISGAKEK